MEEKMQAALSYLREKLFYPGTNLIYDAAVGDLANLPTPQEARDLFPNPCGYGTDMEDSMIHGGTLADACLTLYEKTGRAEYADFALKLLEGLLRCAESAYDPGFIPRSLCPADGKSHYPDSSRDQYTLFAFAALRGVLSPIVPEGMKTRLTCALVNIAKRAERLVLPENSYDLPREDGAPSLVCAMWGDALANHEIFRLPMLYLTAWKASGEEHWLCLYRKYREEALARCLPMTDYWHLYTLQQMQVSLWAALQHDPDVEWHGKIHAVMEAVAGFGEGKVDLIRQKLAAYPDVNFPYTPYRRLLRKERGGFPEKHVRYFAPQHEGIDSFWLLQDAAIIPLLSGLAGKTPSARALTLYRDAFSSIDLSRYTRAAPVHYLATYARCIK